MEIEKMFAQIVGRFKLSIRIFFLSLIAVLGIAILSITYLVGEGQTHAGVEDELGYAYLKELVLMVEIDALQMRRSEKKLSNSKRATICRAV